MTQHSTTQPRPPSTFWPLAKTLEEARKKLTAPQKRNPAKLGAILRAARAIDENMLTAALSFQANKKKKGVEYTLADVLAATKRVPISDIARALCFQMGIPLLELSSLPRDPESEALVSFDLREEFCVEPVCCNSDSIMLACTGPHCFDRTVDLFVLLGRLVVLAHATEESMEQRAAARNENFNF